VVKVSKDLGYKVVSLNIERAGTVKVDLLRCSRWSRESVGARHDMLKIKSDDQQRPLRLHLNDDVEVAPQ
jgi:hypothetical protein